MMVLWYGTFMLHIIVFTWLARRQIWVRLSSSGTELVIPIVHTHKKGHFSPLICPVTPAIRSSGPSVNRFRFWSFSGLGKSHTRSLEIFVAWDTSSIYVTLRRKNWWAPSLILRSTPKSKAWSLSNDMLLYKQNGLEPNPWHTASAGGKSVTEVYTRKVV